VKLYPKAVPYLFLAGLLLASGFAWGSASFRDDIGACLTQPDGSMITLPCEQVVWRGKSGKSFTIKEWTEPRPTPEHPRLVVVSTRPLPVKEYWSCDVSGILSSFSGISRDGGAITQRVLIVSPENVDIYCDPKGRPFLFPPLKSLGMDWANKRTLAELAGTSTAKVAGVSTIDEGTLPSMPDSPDSPSSPVYCATIADAKAQYSSTSRNLVELQCRPFSGATSTQFTLGQDDPADSITVYYTNSASLGTGRINRIVGTIQKGVGNNYWIEVDSGPNWQTGDFAGSVQAISEGSIAWAKTFSDTATLPAQLTGKVVSRVFLDEESFYIQEPDRSSGIRVYDPYMVYSVFPGAFVDIEGNISSSDGERLVEASYTSYPVEYTSAKPFFMTNRNLASGSVNVLTNGAQGASGLNNVGLLVRASGKVTHVDSGFLYIDDGSGCADGTQDGGSPLLGVRVVGSTQYTPSVGDQVAVTGISGLATYASGYGRTLRLADPTELTPLYPPSPPTGLLATPSSASTVLLYWSEVPDASGYNVYRGTASGEENYSSPVNGLIPVTTRVSPTSDLFTFTDSGLQSDTAYYYTVKAITGCGETQASNEDSATPTASAIPWESRDPIAIVAAARLCSPEPVTCRVDVIGPDRTVYTSEGLVFAAAVAGPPGPEPADISASSQGSGQPTPEPNNAHSGPYRKVEAYPGYRKISGYAVVPSIQNHICVTPRTYPEGAQRIKKGKLVPCPNTADIPYMYLGSLGSHLEHMDAGLRYEPSDGMWNMFFSIGPTHTFWVYDHKMPEGADPREYPAPQSEDKPWLDFPSGQSVFLEYWCGKGLDTLGHTIEPGVWLRATGTSGQSAVFAQVSGHPQNDAGVAMKRVSSIGQFLPVNYPQSGLTEHDIGYAKSGSYFVNGEWTGVQVYDMTRAWYVDASHAKYKQEFPVNDPNVVTFHMEAPYYWENLINLDLR